MIKDKVLEIISLEAGYENKQVLFDLSLQVGSNEIVAIIGPNGAGKSTILKAVIGVIHEVTGIISFNNEQIIGATPAKNVMRGITFVPQGRNIFAGLTVLENLEIGGNQLPRNEVKIRVDHILEYFPALKERLTLDAKNLSGGEQQMLSLARSLIPRPKLLMLDEPSLGLSPKIVSSVFSKITEINTETGTAVLIVEQKVREVLNICHRVYSIKHGEVAFEGSPEGLKEDKAKLKDLFL